MPSSSSVSTLTTTYPHGKPILPPNPNPNPIPNSNPNSNTLTIASFNLLAPLYIRPIDQRTGKIQPFASFDWISEDDSDEVLGNNRLPRLLKSMQDCQCDFICVQELQLERQISSGSIDGNDDFKEEVSSTSPFILPKWISPMIQTSSSTTSHTSVNHNNNNNNSNNKLRIPYSIILPQQTELEKIAERNRRVLLTDAAITNAIFYRSDRWKPKADEDHQQHINSTTCVTQAFLPNHHDTSDASDSTSTTYSDHSKDPIVITSIHLDACSEEKRVQQLQRCLQHSLMACDTPYIPPCIIAGDFNCELFDGSCVNAYLSNENACKDKIGKEDKEGKEGKVLECNKKTDENRRRECASALRLSPDDPPSKEQMKDWNELHDSVTTFVKNQLLTLKRIDTGCTRVAYDHHVEYQDNGEGDEVSAPTHIDGDNDTIDATQERNFAQWHLDHIVYTPTTLKPKGRWSTLEEDEYSTAVGLPNRVIPTDHLPIAASFERTPHPQLGKEEQKVLEQSLVTLEDRQTMELQSLANESKQKQAELESIHSHRATQNENQTTHTEGTESSSKKKKNKKAKKAKPSQEIIDHIRNSRAIMKQLKLDHVEERRRFISDIGTLERMVLQYLLGKDITCAKWVESGKGNKG